MHELSLVTAIVEQVERAATAEGAARVTAVRLRIGALAGVDGEALRFAWDVATPGTLLGGAALAVEALPVIIHCPECAIDRTLDPGAPLRCEACGLPGFDVRQGRELEIHAFEMETG